MPREYTPKTIERFWLKVDTSGDCWEWQASTISGYGCFNLGGKTRRAHRISWELHNAPIPDGLYVRHHCDNRACVNPDHLFLGTQADNIRDRGEKGRSAKGEKNSRAKLTEQDVLLIRESTETSVALAKRYGVATSGISRVRNRKIWRHI